MPEPIGARAGKDYPCHQPPKRRAPCVYTGANSGRQGQSRPEQGLPATSGSR
jgi:hypothetical protein